MGKTREKAEEGCIQALVSIPANALMALWGGWMLMLAVGVAHDQWTPTLPTIGYWWAALIVWLLQGAFTTIKPSKN